MTLSLYIRSLFLDSLPYLLYLIYEVLKSTSFFKKNYLRLAKTINLVIFLLITWSCSKKDI
jgi:hypothetical protein